MKSAMGALVMISASCAAVPPEPAPVEEPILEHGGRRCDASRARGLIGRSGTREVGEEALRLTGAGALRWIPPGAVVTMDYREDRLNIELDGRNKVTAIRCG